MHHRRPTSIKSPSSSPTAGRTEGPASSQSPYHGPGSKMRRGRRGCCACQTFRRCTLLLLMVVPMILFALHLFYPGQAGTSEAKRWFSNDAHLPKSSLRRRTVGDRGDIRQFLSRRPLIFISDDSKSHNEPTTVFLDGGHQRKDVKYRRSRHYIDEDSIMQTKKQKKALLDSEDYDDSRRDSLYEGDCEPMHPWQEALFPSGNKMHELGMAYAVSDYVTDKRDRKVAAFSKINSGGYNDIFKVFIDPPVDEEVVLKILEYGTEYTDRNFDRVRRDAVISERLTRSKFIVDVFGHCGLSELAPLGKGSFTLGDTFHERNDAETKLKLSLQAAIGLADMHNIDGDGISAVTHGDLKADQYLQVDGIFKLGDFNRGRFLRMNRKKGEPCPYTIGHNDAKYRSPEEYRYDPQTSKIDVWALGSIFFRILTGEKVWHNVEEKKAQKRIKKGESPPLPEKWKDSTDPVDMLLRKVMYKMCFVPDPQKRPSAIEVADYLQAKAKKLGYDF